jgi:hypothetical protein
VDGFVPEQEQRRHDPVTFPRAKAVFSGLSSAINEQKE